MTTFDDRDKAFENKYAHEEEIAFKVHALTNKLAGMWAAGVLGKKVAEAEAYANALAQDFSHDLAHLADKLIGDFAAAGLPISSKDVRIEVARQEAIARSQIMGNKN